MSINASPDRSIMYAYAGCPVFKLQSDWALKKPNLNMQITIPCEKNEILIFIA